MTRWIRGALALMVVGCGAADVAPPCTEIGCVDGLTVRVTPSSAWPAGDYRFVLDVDGAPLTCTGTLPLSGCDSRAISCDREGVVSITESGCALAPSEHAFGDLHLESAPSALTLEIFRGESSVGRQSYTPTYATLQPNGPDCEPTCRAASVDLALTLTPD